MPAFLSLNLWKFLESRPAMSEAPELETHSTTTTVGHALERHALRFCRDPEVRMTHGGRWRRTWGHRPGYLPVASSVLPLAQSSVERAALSLRSRLRGRAACG